MKAGERVLIENNTYNLIFRMLGFETERRLKNLLLAVAEGENNLERLRQRICDIYNFAPYNAF